MATAAAYAPSLDGEFQFDDERIIERNPLVKDLGRFASADAWALPARPLTTLSLALDYRAAGLEPLRYHLVNLLLHLAVVGLVFALARRALSASGAGGAAGAALATAALFALHPLQVEAVSYVVQRAEVLASLFLLLGLWLLRSAEAALEAGARWPAALRWGGALACAWAGLAAKPVAATLPLAWLLFAQAFGDGRRPALRRRLLLAGPLLLLSAFAAWQGLAATAGTEDAGLGVPGLSPADAWLTQPRVLWRYLALLAVPVGQTVDHEVLPSRTLADPATLSALATLAALVAVAARRLARPAPAAGAAGGAGWEGPLRAAAFGMLWFVVILLPAALVPLADPMAEHRAYLAAFGPLLAAVALVEAALAPRWPALGRGALAAAVAAALGLGTWHRAGDWATRLSLWSSAVEATPGKPRPHLNLGYAWQGRGEHERAVAEFGLALARSPDARTAADVQRNLGASLAQLGRHAEAAAALREAARHPGVEADARALLAMSLVQQGRLDLAAREVARSLEVDPGNGAARNTLGQVLLGRGDPAGAAEQFRLAIRANPDVAVRHANLGLALGRLGRAGEACQAFERALALDRDPARAAWARGEARALGCRVP